MTASDLREQTADELRARAQEMGENLFNLRIRMRGRALDSPGGYRQARKDLARLLTVLREKELGLVRKARPAPAPAAEAPKP